MENELPVEVSRLHKKRRLILTCTVIIVLTISGGLIASILLRAPSVLPASIARQLPFPAYIPGELPGNFAIVEDSFVYEAGVLLFKAEDLTGASIAFTVQQKPTNLDFATFYSEQFKDVKNLNDVPFPSVTGKTQQGSSMLSIITDRTWILASSRSPLSQDDMQRIASSMQIQPKP